jgi:hypothetical protein
MNNQTLLIYDFDYLFEILIELQKELNLNIINVSKNDLPNIFVDGNPDQLLITKKLIPNIKNQQLIEDFPIKISKLIEKINLRLLKLKFSEQSEIKVGKYTININSREMKLNQLKIKLTEKECDLITYLDKLNKPVSIAELQSNVWDHQSKLESHTVETHIYRLRQKISNSFNDIDFILSKKNGYQIK